MHMLHTICLGFARSLWRTIADCHRFGSVDGLDGADFGNIFLEVSLDTDLERDRARGTADAGSVEPNSDDSVIGDLDQFEVTAIGLDRRADQIDDLGHSLAQGAVGEIWTWIIRHGEFLTES